MARFLTRNVRRAAVAATLVLAAPAGAQSWQRVGPLTSHVCSLAADPTAAVLASNRVSEHVFRPHGMYRVKDLCFLVTHRIRLK